VVVEPGTFAYKELEEFQDRRFQTLQTRRRENTQTYHEATHTDPSLIIPIAVRRLRRKSDSGPDELIGMAHLEMAGATLIESMMQLREDSPSAQALAHHTAAQISSIAVANHIERKYVASVIDALAGVIVQLAYEHGIQILWGFPRAGTISMLRAEIPGVLPPYHFTLSPDVIGWKEESAQLAAFRAVGIKGLPNEPFFFHIPTGTLASDLDNRMSLLPERIRLNGAIESQFRRAMINTERALRREIATHYPAAYTREMVREREARRQTGAPRLTSGPRVSTHVSSGLNVSRHERDQDNEFLPSKLATNLSQERYLNQFIESGGKNARSYKELSYELLDPEPGMRVLDVGCGAGVDLPALSQLVGPLGATVGLDHNSDLVAAARHMVEDHKNPQASAITILHGDAQHMTIPDATFERVRTDRALQHFPEPIQAVTEMWRVLAPGGVVTLVEPDWGSIVISPGDPDSHSDATVTKVFGWIQRQLANPFIGRQLNQIFREMPQGAWESVNIVVAPFTFNRWEDVNNLMLLTRAAQALSMEQPTLADELQQWLEAAQRASEKGTFFSYIPIFYGVAVKSTLISHVAI
jgi:ubiquinone/menaquinone biosynthesis C-methylase UbiE